MSHPVSLGSRIPLLVAASRSIRRHHPCCCNVTYPYLDRNSPRRDCWSSSIGFATCSRIGPGRAEFGAPPRPDRHSGLLRQRDRYNRERRQRPPPPPLPHLPTPFL